VNVTARTEDKTVTRAIRAAADRWPPPSHNSNDPPATMAAILNPIADFASFWASYGDDAAHTREQWMKESRKVNEDAARRKITSPALTFESWVKKRKEATREYYDAYVFVMTEAERERRQLSLTPGLLEERMDAILPRLITKEKPVAAKPSRKRSAEEEAPVAKKKKKKAVEEDDTTPLLFFSKSKDADARALSNFAPSWIERFDRWYPTVEHLYQAGKFVYVGAHISARTFSSAERGVAPAVGLDPAAAKKAGNRTAFKRNGLVLNAAGWAVRGPVVMRAALALKFAQPAFAKVLRATGKRPLKHFERTPGVWGTHLCKATGKWKGENLLGRMLEEIRATLPPPQA
jgi:ribA/ribD-fused uncharacterized protein